MKTLKAFIIATILTVGSLSMANAQTRFHVSVNTPGLHISAGNYHRGYYGPAYYAPAPAYCAPAPAYYAPAYPVYYHAYRPVYYRHYYNPYYGHAYYGGYHRGYYRHW